MASKEELLAKAQDAVEKGILTQDNYQTALQATRDNPDLIEYFSSVFPELPEAVETTQLPTKYNFEGEEVDKELFEELSRESDFNFIGDIDPSDKSVPFQEDSVDIQVNPADFDTVNIQVNPADFEKPLTIDQQNINAINNTIDLTDPSMAEFNEVAQSNEDSTMMLAQQRFSAEQIAEMKSNPIGWSEANDFISKADVIPGGGIVKGYEALELAAISKKVYNKEELTEAEETKFYKYIDTELEKSIRGFTWRGGMKYYGSPIPAFMAEFVVAGGVGKIAQKATVEALTAGVMVSAKVAAQARYTGYAAGVTAAAISMPQKTYHNYGELRLGQNVSLTETGMALVHNAQETPYVSALKAFGYTTAEVATEMLGGKIGEHVINPIAGRLATKATTQISKLPPKLIEAVAKAYQKVQPNAKVQEIITRAGWHGALNELGEERVAEIFNTYVDAAAGERFTPEEIWDRVVPNREQFLIEAGLIFTMGGIKTTGVGAYNILKGKGLTEQQVQEALEGLSDEQLEAMVEEGTNVQENTEVKVVLNETKVGDYNLDVEEKSEDQSMLEWMQSTMYNREVEDMSNKQEILQEIEDSELPSYETKREALIARLVKDIEDIEKTAPKLLNFVLEGGALDPDQLIYYGLDPANFNRYDQIGRTIGTKRAPQGRGTSKGKGVKRLWSRNNPTQTISDLTERLNEEYALGNNADSFSDTDVAEMIIEWIDAGDDSIKGTFFDPTTDMKIEERQRYIDELDRLDGEEDIRAYFDTMYQDVAQYNEAEVPVETEASLAGEDIEFADTVDQAEFNNNVSELEAFLIEAENAEKAEMYDQTKPKLLDQFVYQPELVDDAPPMIDHSQSMFASFYAAFVNKFDSVERAMKLARSRGAVILDGANTELLISAYSGIIGNIKFTLQRNTYSMDENGNMVKSGIGLKPILEALDAKLFPYEPNAAKRRADLGRYLIARRIQQDLQNYTIPGERDAAPKVEDEVEIDSGLPDAPNLNEQYDEFIADGENVYDASEQEIADQKEGFAYGYTAAYGEEVEVGDLLGIDDSLSNVFEMGYYYGREAGKANNPKFGQYDSSVVEKTPQPELAGPTQPQPTVVQPDFAKDKKFVGPVTERRVSEEQAIQAEIDLADLAFKYGDAIEFLDSTAEELYGFQKRVLQLFVKSGNMSQEQYNEIIKDNPNYIPFQRVMVNDFLKNKGFNDDQVRKVLSVLSDDEVQQVIDSESLSQDQYDRLIADDPEVIDVLKPLMEPSKGGKGLFTGASSKAIVKRLRGSELAIKDPISSIIGNTARIVEVSSKNNIAKSLVRLSEFIPELIQRIPQSQLMMKVVVDGKEVTVPSGRVPAGAIEVFVDGKRQYFEVSEPLLEAMGGMQAAQLNWLEKLFAGTAGLFRGGATLTPDFVMRNTFKDQFGAAIMSEATATPIDMAKGLASLVGDGEAYNQWKASGGSMGTYMDLTDTGLIDVHKDLMDEKRYIGKVAKSFGLKPFMDFANAAEQSTRVGIFIASKRAGMSDLKAAQESRQGTADFMRSGTAGKTINRYVPFFNAAVQGTDKLIRVFKKNPKQSAAIAAATITFPSVLLTGYYLYGAPDDERQEYLDMPTWVRDAFWIYKSDGEWKRIPKPFAPGYIFGSIPEKFMTWSHQNNNPVGKNIYEEVTKGVLTTMSPVSDPVSAMPPALRLFLETTSNYNWYRNQNIYPDYLDDLEPEFRSTPYTSETARVLGKKFNYSPAKIDSMLQGTIASSAKYVTGAGDKLISMVREANGQEYSARPESNRDIPVWGSFLAQSPVSGNSVTGNTFYDLAQEVKIKTNSAKQYKGDERRDYKDEHELMFAQSGQVQRAAKKIAKLNKKRREVRADLDMTAKEKAERLKDLDAQVYEKAKRSVERYLEAMQDAEKYKKLQ